MVVLAALCHRPGLLLAIAVLGLCAGLAPGYVDNVDARVSLDTARALLDRGSLALAGDEAGRVGRGWVACGADGTAYGKFGPGHALWFVPFVLLGRLLAPLAALPVPQAEEFLVSLSSAVALAIAAAAMFRILTDRLRLPGACAAAGVLAWVFGTFQLSYSGSAYLETPLAAGLVLAAWFALRAVEQGRDSDAFLAGLCAAFLVSVKLAAAVYLPALLFLLPLRSRRGRRHLFAAAVPVFATGVALAVLNLARFGDPLRSGYTELPSLFRTPVLEGLIAYVLDPDLSLPLFAPALLPAALGFPQVWRRSRGLLAAALLVFAGGVLVHACHTGYHGGTAYGPRYLVSPIALLVAPGVAALAAALRPRGRRVLGIALLACAILQVPSALVAPTEYHTLRGRLRAAGLADALPCRVVTDARLLWVKATTTGEAYDLRGFLRPAARAGRGPLPYDVPRAERGLAVWWLLAAREGRPLAVVPGTGLLLCGAAALALLGRRRRPPSG